MKEDEKIINTFDTITQGTMSAIMDLLSENWQWFVLLLLCVFFGILGVHRFRVKKWGTGILFLFTLGLFGIGVIVDLIKILLEQFEDTNDNVIEADLTSTQRFGVFIVILAGLETLIIYFL